MKYLLPDWKSCRRWWSMHVVGLGFVFSAVKAGLVAAAAGAGWFGALRREWAWVMVCALFLVAAIVRVMKQPEQKPPSNAGRTTQ